MKKIKKTQRRQRCRHGRRENQKIIIIIIIIIIMREKKKEMGREKVEHVRRKVKRGHTSFIKKKILLQFDVKI